MISQPTNKVWVRCDSIGVLMTVFTMLVGSQCCYAINQCLVDGRVSYTDQPCPEGAIVKPFIIHADPPNDPEAARQRYQSDLKQLRQLQAQQAAQQQQLEANTRIAAKSSQGLALKAARCHRLESKKRSAQEQLNERKRMASHQQLERARRELLGAEQEVRLQCEADR